MIAYKTRNIMTGAECYFSSFNAALDHIYSRMQADTHLLTEIQIKESHTEHDLGLAGEYINPSKFDRNEYM